MEYTSPREAPFLLNGQLLRCAGTLVEQLSIILLSSVYSVYRPSAMDHTPLPVMCGATVLCSLRYGAWDRSLTETLEMNM